MHHKLRKRPELFTRYDDIIQEQLELRIFEQIPSKEFKQENVHYLPHHAVLREERETTKLRLVYDGSAKSPNQELLLNDCLISSHICSTH